MFYFIEFLRALATILVANSHFKGVYPSDILSFGGGFGLALFYTITGYLLANLKNKSFLHWYAGKLIRVYIPLILIHIIYVLVGDIVINSKVSFVMNFIFPGTWFTASLVILYPVYFILIKYFVKTSSSKCLTAIIISGVIYTLLFFTRLRIASFSLQTMSIENKFSVETSYFMTLFIWLICLLMGVLLRNGKYKFKKRIDYFIFAISVILFAGTKLIVKNDNLINIEYFLGFSYIGFALSVFDIFKRNEAYFRKIWNKPTTIIVKAISASSLEIYYIQFMWIHRLKVLVFPLNLILLFALIILSGFAVHCFSAYLTNIIFKSNESYIRS